ncbi:MAG: AAA family ATPase [Bacteroidales bacterium]
MEDRPMNSAALKRQVGSYKVLPEKYLQPGFREDVYRNIERKLGKIQVNPVKKIEDKYSPKGEKLKIDFPPDKDFWNLKEVMQATFEGIYFILGRLIPAECITLLTGSNDVGKSIFYTQICLAIVQGFNSLFGQKITTNHNRVLIVSTEDSIRAIKDRIKKMLKESSLPEDVEIRFLILTSFTDITSRINNILEQNPCDLVVVDAFADVYEGNINSTNDVRRYMNQYEEIIHKHKCSFLIVHHVGKSQRSLGASKLKVLGSTGIVDKARQVIELQKNSRNPVIRDIAITKGNYNSDEDKQTIQYLKLDPDTLTFSAADDKVMEGLKAKQVNDVKDDGEIKKSTPGRKKQIELVKQAFHLREEGKTLEAIGKIVGKDKSTISKWLKGPDPDNPEDELYKQATKD